MRIMTRDLRTLPLDRAERTPSPYIGTKKEYRTIGTIRAMIQPVTDSLSAALYGNRITKMKNLVCPTGTDVRKDDLVGIDGEKYRIVSILAYTAHIAAVAEKEGQNGDRDQGTGSPDQGA
ncbi:MAG: hypothetical protein NC084_12825 [Bacteroides sp.]|nr:hypothetical protein [Eubacterium sp.]MCM1419615.1 hypothetical protein [Roseburia sp.]MCM1463578.1 hypothetical protein [Bacteroides sp.]